MLRRLALILLVLLTDLPPGPPSLEAGRHEERSRGDSEVSRPGRVPPTPPPPAGAAPAPHPGLPAPPPPTPRPSDEPVTKPPVPGRPIPPPRIIALDPERGQPGQELTLRLKGLHLSGAGVVIDHPGVRVRNVIPKGQTELEVRLVISLQAAPGRSDVTVRTPGGEHTARRAFTVEPAPARPRADFVPDQVIALLRADTPGAVAALVADLERRHGLRLLERHDLPAIAGVLVLFQIPDGRPVSQLVRDLTADPRVFLAQPNHLFRGAAAAYNDPHAAIQYGPVKIRAPDVHPLSLGQGVRVALIDTAVDEGHPDLEGQIAGRADFVGTPLTSPLQLRHGTALAGVIAAIPNNGIGIYGIAPQAHLLALRALEPDPATPREIVGTSVRLARALDHALQRRARVINLSLGGPRDRLLTLLLDRAAADGIAVVAAAGNAGPQGMPLFPAALPSVLAVTATDARDHLYPEASRGEEVALAAPGVEIYTTAPGGGFAFAHGTSLAAAHVSGVLALLLAKSPDASGRALRAALEETARDLGPPGKDSLFGSGLVDACRALRRLSREKVECPPLEPERRAGQEAR